MGRLGFVRFLFLFLKINFNLILMKIPFLLFFFVKITLVKIYKYMNGKRYFCLK